MTEPTADELVDAVLLAASRPGVSVNDAVAEVVPIERAYGIKSAMRRRKLVTGPSVATVLTRLGKMEAARLAALADKGRSR